MRVMRASAVCLLLCVLSGCGRVYSVSTQKKDGGIPFFARTGVCRSEHVWVEPLSVVRLLNIPEGKTAKDATELGTIILHPGTVARKNGKEITLETLRRDSLDPATLWADFQALQGASGDPYGEFDPEGHKAWYREIARTAKTESVVDYAHPQYLNANRPGAGSATLNFELNADGTLSKGQATIESKTMETLTSLIPTKELLSTAAAAAGVDRNKVAILGLPPGFSGTLQLGITPLVFKHTRFAYADVSGTYCTYSDPATNYQYTREELKPDDGNKTDDSKPKLGISGQITLPEDKK